MKTATVAKLKAQPDVVLKQSKAQPVVVTRSGRAVAVLFGVRNDDEAERLLLAHSPKLRAILDAGQRQIDAGQGIPHDEFWRELERKTLERTQDGAVTKVASKRARGKRA
jgi:PHD/YefM family antitoxin component YafN of YafNO toxin-antitoxin module